MSPEQVRGLEIPVDDGDQEHEVVDELVGTTWGNEATLEARRPGLARARARAPEADRKGRVA